MVRSIVLSVLVIGMGSVAGGCAKSGATDAEAPRKIGDLLPGPPPGVSMTYLEDQAGVKLAADRGLNLDEPLESFRKSAKGGASEETSPADESADAAGEDENTESASKDAEGAEAEASTETAEGDAAPAADFGVEIVAAKSRNDRIPPNPEKKGEEFEKAAFEKAKAAAHKNLLDKVRSMKPDPSTTIGEVLESEEATLELTEAFVVSVKWLDANRIEVETQLRIASLVAELNKKTTGGIVPPLQKIGAHRCISATGIGQGGDAPVDRARPGERARRAAEGIGS